MIATLQISAILTDSHFSFELREWFKRHMDTPFTWSVPANKRLELAPGTCVKTSGNLRDVVCGRVHNNGSEDGNAVVIGHGWDNGAEEKFVWRGTRAEFLTTWQID